MSVGAIIIISVLYNLLKVDHNDINAHIIHVYSIENSRDNLIVNNSNCGLLCDYHVNIYLQPIKDLNELKLKKRNIIFSCDSVNDVELSDITKKSAKITRMTGGFLEKCKYKVGDIIKYQ